MTATLITVQLTHIDCWNCHAIYAIDEAARLRYKSKGETWTCPYCAQSTGYGDSDAVRERRLREQAEKSAQFWRERSERAARERVSAEHSARTVRGHMTRLKRRVAAGVCPCCQRTFQDLHRHMKGQHPEYAVAPHD